MKALITATFHPDGLARLRRHMEVDYDDWRASKRIYFDGQQFAARIQAAGADVLIVEADLVHEEVLDTLQSDDSSAAAAAIRSTSASNAPPRAASRWCLRRRATPTRSPT